LLEVCVERRLRGVSKPVFVVPLADLEHGAKHASWTIPIDWLRRALAGTEATPRSDGTLELELAKTGRDVMVRGGARVEVTMPCSRTLDPVDLKLEPEIFLLLAQAQPPAAAAVPRRGSRRRPGQDHKPGGRRRIVAGRDEPAAEQALTADDAARDTFAGEQITLDPFIREFIVLELPMFPMRSDLPSEAPAAIAPASPETDPRRLGEPGGKPRPIDPRLAPLAEIASRLKSDKE
jgi:uncharacterized protein